MDKLVRESFQKAAYQLEGLPKIGDADILGHREEESIFGAGDSEGREASVPYSARSIRFTVLRYASYGGMSRASNSTSIRRIESGKLLAT